MRLLTQVATIAGIVAIFYSLSRLHTKVDAMDTNEKDLENELDTIQQEVTTVLSEQAATLAQQSQTIDDLRAQVAAGTPVGAPEAVYAALVDAGYLAASIETIDGWGSIQRDSARGWAAIGGTLDSMPKFMRDLMTDDVTPSAEHTTA